MLENRYYAIAIFSNEWWINTIATIIAITFLLFISKSFLKNNKIKTFNLIVGSVLLFRCIWIQWYQYYLGIWDLQWSLPLQMCSLSAVMSGILPLIENSNLNKNYKQWVFEFLFYYSIGAFYSILTPVYTTGINGLIYYEYYISHGGILFTSIYFFIILGYRPRIYSWLKVFLYTQPILLAIHLVNYLIGGQANYFYTMEPPIADNPLVMGQYPMHIILLNIFALIHFGLVYFLSKKIK
tara:strand:+ start:1138 stop:1854 length:717 start_codon:yes stop_codon:yes gene_type:complete